MTPLLEVRDLKISYGKERGIRRAAQRFLGRNTAEQAPAVHDASFALHAGETVAVVGESGSGKTTMSRAIAGLLLPDKGQMLFEGEDINRGVGARSKDLQRHIQYVFQNPVSSLNPRRRLTYALGRPLEVFFGLSTSQRRRRAIELLESVHLSGQYVDRFPGQLSGGEAQRVAIAQALAAEPKLILCDEIVSALDVSVQDNILDLLRELQADHGIAYLFIAHDLAVVRWLADRVIVLYQGRVVETGTCEEIFTPPHHPYTEMLLRSIPEPFADHDIGGEADVDIDDLEIVPTSGCPFAPRCPHRLDDLCHHEPPPWQRATASSAVRCHLSEDQRVVLQGGPGAAGGG